MKKTLLQHWPLYASVLILSLLLWLILAISFSQNQGHLVYALDDAYIHMAMAGNFSHYGVWGVTRYGFTSSSSSILWTLLLSLTYYLFGVSQIAPLLWNLLFAVLVLWVAYAILTWYKLPPALKLWTVDREELPLEKRDVARAKQLLKETRYGNGLELTLRNIVGYPQLAAAAQIISENCAEAGIKVKIDTVDIGIWIKDWLAGKSPCTINSWG